MRSKEFFFYKCLRMPTTFIYFKHICQRQKSFRCISIKIDFVASEYLVGSGDCCADWEQVFYMKFSLSSNLDYVFIKTEIMYVSYFQM